MLRRGFFEDNTLKLMVYFVKIGWFFVNYAIFHKLCDLIQFQVDCAKLHHCVISEGKVCFRDPVLIQKPAIKWKNTQLEHAGFKENILNCNANILFQSHLIQWNLNLLNTVARDRSNLFIKGVRSLQKTYLFVIINKMFILS